MISKSYSRFAAETFKDALAPDGSPVRENFLAWFGNSKAVDAQGSPMVFHHGTGSLNSILTKGFSQELLGLGSEQIGSGHYFTNKLSTAKTYAVRRKHDDLPKLGGEDSPGVISAFLSLQNPIMSIEGERFRETLPKLTILQATELIRAAPRVRDEDGPLSDFGEVKAEGFDQVVARAATIYKGGALWDLSNDFYGEEAGAFLSVLARVTGYDGAMHTFSNGEVHAVAWLPWQIKASALNNGLFDRECADPTDARSPRMHSESHTRATAAAAVARDALAPRRVAP